MYTEREKGVVKCYVDDRGYGFIKRPNGQDIFVHITAVKDHDYRGLYAGDKVEYQVMEGTKGPWARDVIRVQ